MPIEEKILKSIVGKTVAKAERVDDNEWNDSPSNSEPLGEIVFGDWSCWVDKGET